MFQGRTVLAQLLDYVPRHAFRRIVGRYDGDRRVRRFRAWDHYVVMAFAQLTYRESLRDIEACLAAVPERLYHSGLRCGPVPRVTLADANDRRDWRLFAELAQVLIAEARRLYADEPWAVELERTVYALDSTVIDLCLQLFPWASFRTTKAGVKVHTLLDLRGNIPTFVWITDANAEDVGILDLLLPEPGAIYVLDRGYVDFARLYQLHESHATFVIRAHRNMRYRRRYSRPVDRTTGLVCDQTVVLTDSRTRRRYPEALRRIRFRDLDQQRTLVFLTNDFSLPSLVVTELYRQRWQIELFFKWIKQHLRIKSFYGTSRNAVSTQVWIAISVYVLVAIVRKRLAIDRELYTLLQILSLTLFEKVELKQILTERGYTPPEDLSRNQLLLFDL